MVKQTIPVLDLTHLTGGGQPKMAFIDTLGKALEDTGFLALVNHDVSRETIDQAYRAAEKFFNLPESAKTGYEDAASKGQRGFTRFGREHAKDHPAPDLKEFWHVGREFLQGQQPEEKSLPNIWPKEIPEFKTALSTLYQQLDRCARQLLEAVSLYVGESQERISEMTRDSPTILRVIHYPPIPENVDPASLRAAPHEDINLITLLCEATAGGLELLSRDGNWLPIQAVSGQIIVDAGDMLQNLTNGLFKSTTHRVMNPHHSRERRFSMPFFVHPRPEVSLSPLPGCIKRTGGQKKFPEITAGEYLRQRLREIGLG